MDQDIIRVRMKKINLKTFRESKRFLPQGNYTKTGKKKGNMRGGSEKKNRARVKTDGWRGCWY